MAEDNKVNPNALRLRFSATEADLESIDAPPAEDLLDAITRRDDQEIVRLLTLDDDCSYPAFWSADLIETIKVLIGRGDYLAAENVLYDAAWPADQFDTRRQYNAAPRWPEIHNQGVLK